MLVYMEKRTIYNKVNKLVKFYGTHDPFTLANKLGIRVYYSAKLHSLLGMYTEQNRTKFIFLNDNVSAEVQRLVLAHELGHAVLHAKLLKHDLYDATALNLKNKFVSQSEHEANFFAAALLINFTDLLDSLQEAKDLHSLAAKFQVNSELLSYALKEVLNTADCPFTKEHDLLLITNFWKKLI